MVNFRAIEKKWQEAWERAGLHKALFRQGSRRARKKWYSLIEFPYPSGDGLHVGHIRSNTAMDVISRKRRMEGYDVLYPIGWDAFGLPTENYAIKTGIDPAIATKKNTDTFRRQLKALGFSFDWSREINTTDPQYYKWTQWMFLQFFKHGLAYKAEVAINWCPKDKIGLANEEAVGGVCDRCGGPIETRMKAQWMLKITAYAEQLLEGLKDVDYIPQAKIQQEHWIGRSEGAIINFQLTTNNLPQKTVEVFTTRPDTLFGATFVAVSAELAKTWLDAGWKASPQVTKYVEATLSARAKAGREEDPEKEKTGVDAGISAVNPATKKEIPVWVVNYVLGNVGTGAIMAVPAHDTRDYAFALRYNLPIKEVVAPQNNAELNAEQRGKVFEGDGILVDSGKFSGMDSEKAKEEIIKFVGGKRQVNYKLRDWVFSRQRYWGEPIPLVFCDNCHKTHKGISNDQFLISKQKRNDYRAEKSKLQIPNPKQTNSKSEIKNSKLQFTQGELLNPGWVAVPDKDLPVTLPKVKNYKPRDDGQSPLASIEKWVNVKCPQCKGPAKRETDVMPNWAGSSWYFLAYIMRKSQTPNSKSQISYVWDKKFLAHWMPVDWYNGGMEHTVLHLLYSRFWNRFLYDLKLVPVAEPYKKRTSHGLVLAEGGVKMSKSKGNVINPDDIVKQFGADTLRVYEMFMGPFDQAIAWNTDGLVGVRRFLDRIHKTFKSQILNPKSQTNPKSQNLKHTNEFGRLLHQTIKKVTEDIEAMRFNTAVSALMVLFNAMEKQGGQLSVVNCQVFLKLLAPFAPHIAEELYQQLTTDNLPLTTDNKKQKINLKAKRLKLKAFQSIFEEAWPAYNEAMLVADEFDLIIQVNGKVRDSVRVAQGISEDEAKEIALGREKIKTFIGGGVKKTIYVPGRLINIVV